MPRNRELTIDQAEARAERMERQQEQWGAQSDPKSWDNRVSAHYRHLGPRDTVRMWKAGVNEKGRPLDKLELAALVEQWCRLFGSLPPFDSSTSAPPAPSEPEPEDTTKLRMRDVVRLTSLSPSTIKRKVRDKVFPAPVKISTRRVAWDAGKVKRWLAEREAGLER